MRASILIIAFVVGAAPVLAAEQPNPEPFVLQSPPSTPPRDAPFKIISVAPAPVLHRSSTPGAWDSVDLLDPAVVRVGSTFWSFYSGYDGRAWRTGVATSADGLHWTRASEGPVLDLGKSGAFDSHYIAANGSALHHGGQFWYWYQGQDDRGETSVGVAISSDGRHFEKSASNPVIRHGPAGTWDEAAVGDPKVIEFDGQFYMYYLGQNSVGTQRIGVAHSADGIVWRKYSGNPILDIGPAGSFDENGLGEPAVFRSGPYFYMLYVGRNAGERRDLGLAASLDGVNWRKLRATGLFGSALRSNWDSMVVCDPSIVKASDNELLVFFGGGDVASPDQNLHGSVGLFRATAAPQIDRFNPGDWSSGDSTAYLRGSYPIETAADGSRFVWMSPHASITLTAKQSASAPTSLHVKGYVAEGNGSTRAAGRFKIAVTIDSRALTPILAQRGQQFDVRLPLGSIPPNQDGAYTVALNGEVLAHNAADKRILSFILSDIALE